MKLGRWDFLLVIVSFEAGPQNACRQEYAKGSCSWRRQQREYESRLLAVGKDVPMIERCYFKFSVGAGFHLALIGCPKRTGVESTLIHRPAWSTRASTNRPPAVESPLTTRFAPRIHTPRGWIQNALHSHNTEPVDSIAHDAFKCPHHFFSI